MDTLQCIGGCYSSHLYRDNADREDHVTLRRSFCI